MLTSSMWVQVYFALHSQKEPFDGRVKEKESSCGLVDEVKNYG